MFRQVKYLQLREDAADTGVFRAVTAKQKYEWNSTVDEHKQRKTNSIWKCQQNVAHFVRLLLLHIGSLVWTLSIRALFPPSPWQAEDRSRLPQPIELRLGCLRAARDKLPRGLYAVSVTLHQRLGGAAIAWCGERTTHHQCAVFTEPVEHQGRHYDTDLHINHNLLMVSVCLIAGLWQKLLGN